jgi:glycyl-tRNA synthetase beta chain
VVGVSDFLLELRCEEIPARMQAGARVDLEKLFRKEMQAAGVTLGEITVWSSPRRLALIARDLPPATAAVSEELKGPRLGAPPQALEGFLRKTGLRAEQLVERDGVLYAVTEKPGRATAEVLAEAIPAIVRAFPWPKSMRWGAASLSTESLRWVRPLSGIVALLGEDLVACEVGGVASGYATLGHRFHHPGEITIGSAADYQQKLRACHVIVDHAERQDLIRERARAAAAAEGLELVEDEGLVVENAGLTEWPVPLLGRFDEAFLEVPPEVIQLTARTNQKYFVCEKDGKLANAFVCTANIAASDGGAEIVAGNRKVLAARLADARFFWEQDRKKTLASHAEGLARITFHEKLGTVADKVERVAKLARWLVEEGIVKSSPERGGGSPSGLTEGVHLDANAAPAGEMGPLRHAFGAPPPRSGEDLADLAEQAARLCKADLVTEMVGEFPELQGVMGGYYARAEGLDPLVAEAIRDHYKPVGQGDEVPTAPVTVAVSLADKLDNIAKFFEIDELPTGSKDPFALRRAALGVGRLVLKNNLRFSLSRTFAKHLGLTGTDAETLIENGMMEAARPQLRALAQNIRDNPIDFSGLAENVRRSTEQMQKNFADLPRQIEASFAALRNSMVFLADRLKVQQREAGVRHDLIDAVFALGGEDDLVRLLARVHALQAFVGTEDGANLLAGYKRAANILKKEGYSSPLPVGEGSGVGVPPSQDGANPHPTLPDGEGYDVEPAEAALIAALDAAEPRAEAAIAAEDFTAAMAALASLRAPIDAFFDAVTVNDADPAKRAARLALLERFRVAVHKVADFSRIEG